MSISRRRLVVLAGALAALVVVTAVAVSLAVRRTSGDTSAGWLDALDTVQGQWVSATGHAADGTTPWTAPVALTVTDNTLLLHAGCNSLSAAVEVRDHRLYAADGVTTTELGCDAARHARDAWLTALVDDHATIALKGSTDGPMLALDTDAGWIGFVQRSTTPGPTPTGPDATATPAAQ